MGNRRVDAAVIDDALLRDIELGAEIAPLHNGPALEALADAQRELPDVPHVAVSDSHFHHTLPPVAREYAIAKRLRDPHQIVRHGFHGLSVTWAAERVRASRLVVCHLGGGCSVTAVRDGCSVDTTMGWTPLEGLPGATRSGSVDPGALLYLMRHGTAIDDLDRALEHESGLKALGGLDDPLGLDVFTYRVAQAVASMTTALSGLDALVFTAGIGENRPDVRVAVTDRLGFLGIQVDAARNADAVPDCHVAAEGSPVRVLVLRAREEIIAARVARAVLAPVQKGI
jgi:acetate kinase